MQQHAPPHRRAALTGRRGAHSGILPLQVLTVRTERHRLVSCPIHIIGDRYPRNYLLFNVAAVFAADVDVAPFEPVVRKLALALRSVELETGYIVGEGKSHLQRVLDSVRWELNHSGRVDVPIDLANTLRLQIPSAREVCPQVELQEVPVPLVDLKALPREHLDWAITEILPYIDGANYAKAIAERSEVHIAIVLKALSCLAARRLVAIVPAFQFHSLYLVTRTCLPHFRWRGKYTSVDFRTYVLVQVKLDAFLSMQNSNDNANTLRTLARSHAWAHRLFSSCTAASPLATRIGLLQIF